MLETHYRFDLASNYSSYRLNVGLTHNHDSVTQCEAPALETTETENSEIYLQSGCEGQPLWESGARRGKAQLRCPHYRPQTVMMKKRDDSFHVRPSFMSNGPMIN